MQDILFDYRINPTTWAYLSSLLTIGIYFKFHRFWSVRNLDLAMLICFAPGLLLIYYGMKLDSPWRVQGGYLWIFAVNGFFLIRMLMDPVMVRRPLLEPNLSVSGLTFTGISLLVFLMANVVNYNRLHQEERLENLLSNSETAGVPASPDNPETANQSDTKHQQISPGYALFHNLAGFSSRVMMRIDNTQPDEYRRQIIQIAAARTGAILGHLAVLMGLVLVGYRHFDNIHTGVAVATLYLLFFYTSQMTGQVDHVIPAALLVWAVAVYRRPMVAGIFIGLAAGVIYYPFFLLPLWCGFYWQRGVTRFLTGVALALAILVGTLALTAENSEVFLAQLRLMFGVRDPFSVELTGFWGFHESFWRIPVLTAFVLLCLSLALWPPQKNLSTLLSCSAAVLIAAQFWHAKQGGIYIAWYLPLLLLTIFRPNLEDRTALAAVRDIRWPWRKGGKGISRAPLQNQGVSS
jgi:hypothetical protein